MQIEEEALIQCKLNEWMDALNVERMNEIFLQLIKLIIASAQRIAAATSQRMYTAASTQRIIFVAINIARSGTQLQNSRVAIRY